MPECAHAICGSIRQMQNLVPEIFARNMMISEKKLSSPTWWCCTNNLLVNTRGALLKVSIPISTRHYVCCPKLWVNGGERVVCGKQVTSSIEFHIHRYTYVCTYTYFAVYLCSSTRSFSAPCWIWMEPKEIQKFQNWILDIFLRTKNNGKK